MTEIVVYELVKPAATRSASGTPDEVERRVRRVHAAPAAPGSHTAVGPRTLCGKDTFAMETSHWKPSDHPGEPWYPAEYASLVCTDCNAVIET
ncbi:hypothetical protein ABZ865_36360 [Streptomyces sp. NPDC047085]|uniref:hypothetical protein n=1 Tax=Streptomyces sp. NPDC047085 TaxID=3155140 RepID=UPI0033F505E7